MSSATLARDEAIDRVEENAHEAWKKAAYMSITCCLTEGMAFTTDDLWRLLEMWGYQTHEPRAMGAIIRDAQRRGWIKPQGWTQSTRKECHARPVRVWVGV